MKIELHTKKIDEADDIQDGGEGKSNISQDLDVRDQQPSSANTDTSEINIKINDLSGQKMRLKTQYAQDLKTINDQIVGLQKQKTTISSTPTQNGEQITEQKTKITKINKNIVELVNRKLTRKTTYQNDVRNIEQNLVGLYKQQVDNGGDVDPKCVDESLKPKYRFSRKLYEAVINKTDQMYGLISLAFDNMDKLTYKPNVTQCKTYAKNIIGELNKIDAKGGDVESFRDFLYNMLTRGHIPFTEDEKDRFIDGLLLLMKENQAFVWLFRNENQETKI